MIWLCLWISNSENRRVSQDAELADSDSEKRAIAASDWWLTQQSEARQQEGPVSNWSNWSEEEGGGQARVALSPLLAASLPCSICRPSSISPRDSSELRYDLLSIQHGALIGARNGPA